MKRTFLVPLPAPFRDPLPAPRGEGRGEGSPPVANAKRRDAFTRQAAKIKKVAARTVGSGRSRGR